MKYDREYIIEEARKIHGDKYDYTITEGVNSKIDKIKYRCRKHDYIHEQGLHNHLQGKGCPLCAKEKRRLGRVLEKNEFLEKIKKRGDLDKYDFDKIDFNFRDEFGRMEIYCKEHGRFLIRPSHFINGVEGCEYCNGRKKDDEKVRKELSEKHPNLDFSETKYSEKDCEGRIKVICPEHGLKLMRYWNLMNGEGCYECSMRENGLKTRLTNEEIIRRGEEVYGKGTYTYENLDTLNRDDDGKITVTCPKHGNFKVLVGNFVTGKSGCPTCKRSKLETRMYNFLSKNKIKFETQKRFNWLKYKSYLYLDFYLPDYNIAIECQGIQHFQVVECFGEKNFIECKERDKKKKMLCEEHGIKILYYTDKQHVKNKNDFSSLNKLLKIIKKKIIYSVQ